MSTKRRILLAELASWRDEGILDEATYFLLRSRYEHAPPSDALDRELAAPAAPTGERRSFAADSMQFVGGLLLGAGLVALVVFLDLAEGAGAYALLLLGALLLSPAMLGAWRGAPPGLVEAGLAGGLVPMLVANGLAMQTGGSDPTRLFVPLLVAATCVGVLLLRRGQGPSTLVAGGGFVWSSAAATLLREDVLFGEPQMTTRWMWFLALLALGALLLVWRGRLWTEISLGALVAPATLAFGLLLDPLHLAELGTQLAIGAFLAPVLVGGVVLGSRGLVTGAAAGLTIDAVAFAFEIGGPGTAVVVLLALGGLLVWQAEAVRRYYRRAPS